MQLFDSPYREAPPQPRHVCLVCLATYGLGPSSCPKCHVPRISILEDDAYSDLVRLAQRRREVIPWWTWLFLIVPVGKRWIDSIERGRRRRLPLPEDFTRDELIDFLKMKRC